MTAWRQRLKWLVYAALVANFCIYLYQDIEYAPYVLDADSSLREVFAAYVTSIDLVAWFTLILLFEVETTVRAGRPWQGAAKWAVKSVRLACYATVLHTTFANVVALGEFRNPEPLPPAADVCAYAGEWTLLRNRDFLEIDADNCRTLARGPGFFALSGDRVLTDRDGLAEGTLLAWTDVAESVAWLLIVALTEIAVRRLRINRGLRPRSAHILRVKILLYAAILAISLFWGSKGQVLYLWDELVWILGFLAIDWNLRDWRRFQRAFSVSPSAA
jgi:hypothetical protein